MNIKGKGMAEEPSGAAGVASDGIRMPTNVKASRFYYRHREEILERRRARREADPEYAEKKRVREERREEREAIAREKERLREEERAAKEAKRREKEVERDAKREEKARRLGAV